VHVLAASISAKTEGVESAGGAQWIIAQSTQPDRMLPTKKV
jgi:hypothetical protein